MTHTKVLSGSTDPDKSIQSGASNEYPKILSWRSEKNYQYFWGKKHAVGTQQKYLTSNEYLNVFKEKTKSKLLYGYPLLYSAMTLFGAITNKDKNKVTD